MFSPGTAPPRRLQLAASDKRLFPPAPLFLPSPPGFLSASPISFLPPPLSFPPPRASPPKPTPKPSPQVVQLAGPGAQPRAVLGPRGEDDPGAAREVWQRLERDREGAAGQDRQRGQELLQREAAREGRRGGEACEARGEAVRARGAREEGRGPCGRQEAEVGKLGGPVRGRRRLPLRRCRRRRSGGGRFPPALLERCPERLSPSEDGDGDCCRGSLEESRDEGSLSDSEASAASALESLSRGGSFLFLSGGGDGGGGSGTSSPSSSIGGRSRFRPDSSPSPRDLAGRCPPPPPPAAAAAAAGRGRSLGGRSLFADERAAGEPDASTGAAAADAAPLRRRRGPAPGRLGVGSVAPRGMGGGDEDGGRCGGGGLGRGGRSRRRERVLAGLPSGGERFRRRLGLFLPPRAGLVVFALVALCRRKRGRIRARGRRPCPRRPLPLRSSRSASAAAASASAAAASAAAAAAASPGCCSRGPLGGSWLAAGLSPLRRRSGRRERQQRLRRGLPGRPAALFLAAKGGRRHDGGRGDATGDGGKAETVDAAAARLAPYLAAALAAAGCWPSAA